MRKNVLSLALAIIFGASATATTPGDNIKKEVKVDESSVMWKAYKVTGSHTGLVKLQEDLEGEYKGKLEGHLKSDDFFGIENHTSSKLVFTNVQQTGKNSYEVIGDLTIKGITKPITFDVSVYGSKATASLKIDRANYDIRYGSGSFFDNLGDKTIYDEFDLVVDLVF
jgi:polyisoprenoid-binding protein YceI